MLIDNKCRWRSINWMRTIFHFVTFCFASVLTFENFLVNNFFISQYFLSREIFFVWIYFLRTIFHFVTFCLASVLIFEIWGSGRSDHFLPSNRFWVRILVLACVCRVGVFWSESCRRGRFSFLCFFLLFFRKKGEVGGHEILCTKASKLKNRA